MFSKDEFKGSSMQEGIQKDKDNYQQLATKFLDLMKLIESYESKEIQI